MNKGLAAVIRMSVFFGPLVIFGLIADWRATLFAIGGTAALFGWVVASDRIGSWLVRRQ